MNSFKHGAYASRITPPSDPRGDDELFREYLRELTEEFAPTTFTEKAAVSELANEYVQLGRVRAMYERVYQLAMTREDEQSWSEYRNARDDHELVEDALRYCDPHTPFAYRRRAAERLAELVAATAEKVLGDFEHPDPDEPDPEEMDEQDYASWRQEQWLGKKLQHARHACCDREHLADLFSGDRRSRKGELVRIRAVLESKLDVLRVRRHQQEQLERRYRETERAQLASIANDPSALERLQRLQRRHEQAIDRLLSQLRDRRTSGSFSRT